MRSLLLAAAALLSSSLVAHADTFSYDLSFGDQGFTYTSPDLITSATTFTPTTCNVSDGSLVCTSITVDPPDGSISFLDGTYAFEYLFARSAAFFTVGTHTEYDTTLTITDIPGSPSSVSPEPSSLALLGTGVLGVVGVVKRRFA